MCGEILYDRDEELNEIFEALKLGERFVVVYGVRRVGKTSLVKVALRKGRVPHVLVDVRKVFYEHGSVPRAKLYEEIARCFSKNMKLYERLGFDLRQALRRVKSFRVGEVGVELEPGFKPDLAILLESVDSWCEKHGVRFVFAFDEAQYLRYGGGVRYDGIIAWCVDSLPNVTVVVTGSEVGVLRDFLRLEDPRAPLFGRYRREILVDRFSRETGVDFLARGFEELGLRVSEKELEEAVALLDGIVGWLTYYGYYRGARGMGHEEALEAVFSEGSKLVQAELEKLIAPSRKRYAAILKAVAQGARSWSDIKAYVVAKAGPLTDKRLSSLLEKLVKYGYSERENDYYGVPDPVVKHVALRAI